MTRKTSSIFKTSLLLGTLGVMAFPLAASAAEMTKEDVQATIKDYLMANPELIVQSLEAYRAKQEQAQEQKMVDTIRGYKTYFDSESPSIGAKDATITIVEFFDYNCGYCKRAFPDIQSMVKDNKDVKAVFQEMPILSPSSKMAAQWALAAHKQGKYFEFHGALMKTNNNKTEEILTTLAKETGLDVEKLKKDADSQEIKDQVEKSLAVSRELGIEGTPAFIINDTVYRGYLGPDGMKQALAEERAKLTAPPAQ